MRILVQDGQVDVTTSPEPECGDEIRRPLECGAITRRRQHEGQHKLLRLSQRWLSANCAFCMRYEAEHVMPPLLSCELLRGADFQLLLQNWFTDTVDIEEAHSKMQSDTVGRGGQRTGYGGSLTPHCGRIVRLPLPMS